MTFLMEALPVASQLPRKLDVRAGDSQSYAAARANAPRNVCFGRKKKKTCFDEEVLLFQGEEGKKNRLSKKLGSLLVWRVTHPIECSRCQRKYWDASERSWLPSGSLDPFKIQLLRRSALSQCEGSSHSQEDPFVGIKSSVRNFGQ